MRPIFISTLCIASIVVLSYYSNTQAMTMGVHKLFGEESNKQEAADTVAATSNDRKPYQSIEALEVADLDNDGVPEVILLYSNSVKVIDAEGRAINSTPLTVLNNISGVESGEAPFHQARLLSISDINGDGKQEMLISDGVKIIVLDGSGKHIFSILP